MLQTFIVLLSISILVILVSFFLRDPYKQLSDEIDQLTLQQAQELYLIKKKLSILEEELLIDDFQTNSRKTESKGTSQMVVHDIIKNQIISLAQQGKTIGQIAHQSSLSEDVVLKIINENRGS